MAIKKHQWQTINAITRTRPLFLSSFFVAHSLSLIIFRNGKIVEKAGVLYIGDNKKIRQNRSTEWKMLCTTTKILFLSPEWNFFVCMFLAFKLNQVGCFFVVQKFTCKLVFFPLILSDAGYCDHFCAILLVGVFFLLK